jgi:hypothetical protein
MGTWLLSNMSYLKTFLENNQSVKLRISMAYRQKPLEKYDQDINYIIDRLEGKSFNCLAPSLKLIYIFKTNCDQGPRLHILTQ